MYQESVWQLRASGCSGYNRAGGRSVTGSVPRWDQQFRWPVGRNPTLRFVGPGRKGDRGSWSRSPMSGILQTVWARSRAQAPVLLLRKLRPQRGGDYRGCTADVGRAGSCPQPPASQSCPQGMCSSTRTLTHTGTGHMGHTRGHGAQSQVWVVLFRTWDPRRVGWGLLHGASSFPWWEGGGCPGVRKKREGRRKPLFCVLFLVRKMKWLLGANKGPFETRCSVSLQGPPSLLLPPPQPALAPVCECVTHGER